MDPLMIVDGVHFLHRFNIAQPRAALSIGNPEPPCRSSRVSTRSARARSPGSPHRYWVSKTYLKGF